MTAAMQTGIYTGTVRHRRYATVQREFQYQVFMVLLDADQPLQLFRYGRLWSAARSLVQFRRNDYLPGAASLGDEVRASVQKICGQRPEGPVMMLTNPRIFGYLINPITVFYCLNEAGDRIEYMVLEVTNTPWKERQRYVLSCDPSKSVQRIRFNKTMHVSPFLPMAMQYQLITSLPRDKVALHLQNYSEGNLDFDATLALGYAGAGRRAQRRVIWQYPLMTLKVFAAIHWQAILLWLKKVPVVPHAAGNKASPQWPNPNTNKND